MSNKISFVCPHCFLVCRFSPTAAGKMIRCPTCKGLFASMALAASLSPRASGDVRPPDDGLFTAIPPETSDAPEISLSTLLGVAGAAALVFSLGLWFGPAGLAIILTGNEPNWKSDPQAVESALQELEQDRLGPLGDNPTWRRGFEKMDRVQKTLQDSDFWNKLDDPPAEDNDGTTAAAPDESAT